MQEAAISFRSSIFTAKGLSIRMGEKSGKNLTGFEKFGAFNNCTKHFGGVDYSFAHGSLQEPGSHNHTEEF